MPSLAQNAGGEFLQAGGCVDGRRPLLASIFRWLTPDPGIQRGSPLPGWMQLRERRPTHRWRHCWRKDQAGRG